MDLDKLKQGIIFSSLDNYDSVSEFMLKEALINSIEN